MPLIITAERKKDRYTLEPIEVDAATATALAIPPLVEGGSGGGGEGLGNVPLGTAPLGV